MCNLLAQLGPPPDQETKGKSLSATGKLNATNQLFLEFMQRNEKRNIDPVVAKKMFYEGGVSKARNPVFYYIARKFETSQFDEELLMFIVFQTLKRMFSFSISYYFQLFL